MRPLDGTAKPPRDTVKRFSFPNVPGFFNCGQTYLSVCFRVVIIIQQN